MDYVIIGLVVLGAALLYAAYRWCVEYRTATRLNRIATRRRAASKFKRTISKIRKEQEQGRK